MAAPFGYSIGDFVGIGALAWRVYKACKNAPDSFGSISTEVLSLHAVLKEAEETIFSQPLPDSKQERLRAIGEGCRLVLDDLEKLVERYRSLGTQSKRTWDRMKWGLEDVGELRTRLTANTTLLSAWLCLSQAGVERRLNEFLEEYRRGARPSSIISAETRQSISDKDEEIWQTIRDELEEAGITVAAFDANKQFIFEWLVNALKNNAFVVDEGSSTFDAQVDGAQVGLPERIQLLVPPSPTVSNSSGTTTGSSPTPVTKPDLKLLRPLPPRPMSLFEALTSLSPNSTIPQDVSAETSEPISLQDALVEVVPILELAPDVVVDHETSHPPATKSRGWLASRTPGLANTRLAMALTLGNGATVHRIMENEADLKSVKPAVFIRALEWAVRQGDVGLVRFMLKSGIKTVDNGTLNLADIVIRRGGDGAVVTSQECLQAIFHFAASTRDLDTMEKLLKRGISINAWGKQSGRTALQEAVRTGNPSIIRFLLINGADVDSWDRSTGWTVLTEAAHYGREEIVSLLLEYGVDITPTVSAGDRSPLYQAVLHDHPSVIRLLVEKIQGPALDDGSLNVATRRGDVTVVKLLLDRGADPNYVSGKTSIPALVEAASSGNDQIVIALLFKGADPNVVHEGVSASSPLVIALRNGHYSTVEILLNHGANPNAVPPEDQLPPLCLAIRIGHLRLIQLLLEKGADVNICGGGEKIPPLSLATRRGDYNLVKLLLDNGADPNYRYGIDQLPALSFAASNGSSRIVRALLQAGADIDAETRDSKGSLTPRKSALSFAVEYRHESIVSLLLEEGAAIPFDTLHCAARAGDYRIVQLLLEAGAQDKDGALFYACEHGHLDIVQLLLNNHANLNSIFLQISSIHRCTPLHSASANGSIKIARLLLQRGAHADVGCNADCPTPILLATRHGHEQLVWLLLEHGAAVTDRLIKEAKKAKKDNIVTLLRVKSVH